MNDGRAIEASQKVRKHIIRNTRCLILGMVLPGVENVATFLETIFMHCRLFLTHIAQHSEKSALHYAINYIVSPICPVCCHPI